MLHGTAGVLTPEGEAFSSNLRGLASAREPVSCLGSGQPNSTHCHRELVQVTKAEIG
jgi:hypothetical protein